MKVISNGDCWLFWQKFSILICNMKVICI